MFPTPAFLKTSLLAAALMLTACNANVNVRPNPTPTATPVPSPTPTPGWVTATIRPSVETNDAVLAEVQRLQTAGLATDVLVMESYPVQIRLTAAPETIAALEDLAAGVETVPTTTLSQRSSNIQTAGARTVVNSPDFAAIWRQHTSASDTPPTVDFNSQTVLAVFAGERPTGGYTARITSVKRLNKVLTVRYRVDAPAPNTPTTQILTYPAHLVTIPLSQQRGDFETVNFVME
ncbi:MAG: hypothetical protein CVV27_08425 [Candidatus Melainabacteria bacterium HGW-Melainabacteria-1]|nr:MAG: hypothetical protein CVV27_08425 [Candidatus Melainabacteria bacterium HGW-Melainabacteria-1]